MKCTEVRALFSSYLDGAVTGVEMHEISGHLRECVTCQPEYDLLEIRARWSHRLDAGRPLLTWP